MCSIGSNLHTLEAWVKTLFCEFKVYQKDQKDACTRCREKQKEKKDARAFADKVVRLQEVFFSPLRMVIVKYSRRAIRLGSTNESSELLIKFYGKKLVLSFIDKWKKTLI